MPSPLKPKNIRLIMPDVDIKTLPEVTSTLVMVASTQQFHPEGLFSTEIFGPPGSVARLRNLAYINLRTQVVHPRIFIRLVAASTLISDICRGKTYAIWDKKLKNFVKSDIESGQTGFGFFMDHVNELVLEDTGSVERSKLIALLKKYPDRKISKMIVYPAGLRDYSVDHDGRPTQDEVNGLYVGLLNSVAVVPTNVTDKTSLDIIRLTIQNKVNELHLHYLKGILFGKNAYINKRWVNTRVHGGTKNVMTAFIPTALDMDDPSRSKITDTHISLFQLLKAAPYQAVYGVRQLLGDILQEEGAMRMSNKKTLSESIVEYDDAFYQKLMSTEGIQKLINTYRYEGVRLIPIEYGDYYLHLICEDLENKRVMLLSDISHLPEGWPKDKVRPIHLSDIFYMATYQQSHRKPSTGTRYPVMAAGGIHVATSYLKPTNHVTSVTEYDKQGTPVTEYASWPLYKSGFFTSVSLNPSRLGRVQGDHDGDMLGVLKPTSKEAIDEIHEKLSTADGYLHQNGGLLYSLGDGSLPLILKSITE
jgi:hypothetical protein